MAVKITKRKKLIEERSILDIADFDDPASQEKRKSRVAIIQRTVTHLERAAKKAEELGNTEQAEELRKRAKELRDFTNNETYKSDPMPQTSSQPGQTDPDAKAGKGEKSGNPSEQSAKGKVEDGNGDKGQEPADAEDNNGEEDPSDAGDGEDRIDAAVGADDEESGSDSAGSGASSKDKDDPNGTEGNKGQSSADDGDSDDEDLDGEMEIDLSDILTDFPKPSKKMDVDAIIKQLKKLKGNDHADAERALKDILQDRGASISEALRPMPEKSMMELSDDEFNSMINNILDELDKISPIKFADPIDRKARIQKIKDDNDNAVLTRSLEQEERLNRQRDVTVLKAREREKDKYRNFRSIEQFKIDFWRAIKDQVKQIETTEETPTRINRRYEGEDIIKNGERIEDKWEDKQPCIDFYFDMSASWTRDTKAIDIGKQIVKTVKGFEDAGKIKLNVFYFSEEVTTNMNSPILGKNTWAWGEILEQIEKDKANNVVLMTDWDMGDSAVSLGKTCVVDGGVWIIWRNSSKTAQSIPSHLMGKRINQQYAIES